MIGNAEIVRNKNNKCILKLHNLTDEYFKIERQLVRIMYGRIPKRKRIYSKFAKKAFIQALRVGLELMKEGK